MKWSEVNGIEESRSGSWIISSTYVPAITVSKSIIDDPRFRSHVLTCVPADHLIARKLAGAGAGRDG